MHKITNQIYSLIESSESIDEIIDYVYDSIDDLLLASKFNEVDKILSEIDLAKLPTVIMLGLLTITFQFRNQSSARAILYKDIEKQLLKSKCEDLVKRLLDGLEC